MTGVSSASFPSSTSRNIPLAATGLLIDAAWKSVFASTESAVPSALSPYPRAHTMRPLSTTAMETPGTL